MRAPTMIQAVRDIAAKEAVILARLRRARASGTAAPAEIAALERELMVVQQALADLERLSREEPSGNGAYDLATKAALMRANDYRYPGPVILQRERSFYGKRELIVGHAVFRVRLSEYFVLTALIDHAHITNGQFMQMVDLLWTIEQEAEGLQNRDGSLFAKDPSPNFVHKAVCHLRSEFKSAQIPEALIQSDGDAGWRLSCIPDEMEKQIDGVRCPNKSREEERGKNWAGRSAEPAAVEAIMRSAGPGWRGRPEESARRESRLP